MAKDYPKIDEQTPRDDDPFPLHQIARRRSPKRPVKPPGPNWPWFALQRLVFLKRKWVLLSLKLLSKSNSTAKKQYLAATLKVAIGGISTLRDLKLILLELVGIMQSYNQGKCPVPALSITVVANSSTFYRCLLLYMPWLLLVKNHNDKQKTDQAGVA